MITVRFKTMFATQQMSLEKALMPDVANKTIVSNQLSALSVENAEITSRLLAHLVETEQMSIETAFQIAGVYVEELEIVSNPISAQS